VTHSLRSLFLGLSVVGLVLGACVLAQGEAPAQTAASYTCPMHADVREAGPGRCPQCGMPLVLRGATPRGEYVLEVSTSRPVRATNRARARLSVREPMTGARVTRFEEIHERLFHLFVISHDLKHFSHVHPTIRDDGSFEVDLVLPEAGGYQLLADFLPSGGFLQLAQKTVFTQGYDRGYSQVSRELAVDVGEKISNGTRVKLEVGEEQVAGRPGLISCRLEDADTGEALTDLEPYLGSWGHLVIVSADFADVIHSHAITRVSRPAGSRIQFIERFPRPGFYRMWAQFRRGGTVATASFTIEVGSAANQPVVRPFTLRPRD